MRCKYIGRVDPVHEYYGYAALIDGDIVIVIPHTDGSGEIVYENLRNVGPVSDEKVLTIFEGAEKLVNETYYPQPTEKILPKLRRFINRKLLRVIRRAIESQA